LSKEWVEHQERRTVICRPAAWLESHANEIGVGSCAHLVHGGATMDFNSDFANPDIAGHLLVSFFRL
jgi:hypothetical protein